MSVEMKRTFKRARPDRVFLAVAILAAAILSLLVAGSGSAAVETLRKVGGQGLPLGEVLRPDGTLALSAGFRGSLDARGWQLASGMGEAPRFAPQTTTAGGRWADVFNPLGTNGTVYALAVDGDGTLYAAGDFATAGRVSANNIAKWDGAAWSTLGSGTNGGVLALAVDGHGNLYVGGNFTSAGGASASNIAKWDGSSWSTLGSGMNSWVDALAVDDNGNLYAGGNFTNAGGVSANYIARWDGANWTALGSGMDGPIRALAVDVDGNLYAGGWFATAGGVSAHYIAVWEGSRWSALGSGMASGGAYGGTYVTALAIDGAGNLYAGGEFTIAGGVSANHIAKWDGTSWSALGGGTNRGLRALAFDSDGALYAGGHFSTAGLVDAENIARWDGANWSALGDGTNSPVLSLVVGGDRSLYAGGHFSTAGSVGASNIARWDRTNWSALGSGGGMNDEVYALAVDGDGSLYAGGRFTDAGGMNANHIARWDGSGWSALGSGIHGSVNALAVDGDGNLYAGGTFTFAGTVSANHIARWDGANWSALGGGMAGGNPYYDTYVRALAVDGDGNLYAGGDFTYAGGVSASYIAKWDGASWSPLGSGLDGGVYALAVDRNGNLYAGGGFNFAGGVGANHIAKWDGARWSALGNGIDGYVSALAVDGDGILYANGWFATAGGVSASYIARWDGSSWSAFGNGMTGDNASDTYVSALAVDGAGNLYAGGYFAIAGEVDANHIARWDGSDWSALGSGMGGGYYNYSVSSLTVDGDGNLYAGGYFTTAGGKPSAYIALWITVPYAAFSASPRSGIVPLTVNFTNQSIGNFDTCTWNFGDGSTSTDCNDPSHHYTKPGVYEVSLTVSGPAVSDTETKTKYITVNEYGSRLPIIIIGK